LDKESILSFGYFLTNGLAVVKSGGRYPVYNNRVARKHILFAILRFSNTFSVKLRLLFGMAQARQRCLRTVSVRKRYASRSSRKNSIL
jgi:hypothetical protein